MVIYAKHRERFGLGGEGGKSQTTQPNDRDKELATALYSAMEAGNAQRVDELLRNGFVCETLRSVSFLNLTPKGSLSEPPFFILPLSR